MLLLKMMLLIITTNDSCGLKLLEERRKGGTQGRDDEGCGLYDRYCCGDNIIFLFDLDYFSIVL